MAQGQEGTFLSSGDVLYVTLGGGYLGDYICKKIYIYIYPWAVFLRLALGGT